MGHRKTPKFMVFPFLASFSAFFMDFLKIESKKLKDQPPSGSLKTISKPMRQKSSQIHLSSSEFWKVEAEQTNPGEWPAKGRLNVKTSRNDVWSTLNDHPCDGMEWRGQINLSNWVVPHNDIARLCPSKSNLWDRSVFSFLKIGKQSIKSLRKDKFWLTEKSGGIWDS
ncbi:hypothetical protein IM774_05045 [Erysipelotrichaceae bacterium RD49]|nr:hypothetical protein [Erysipelotrichaceae bacterium RD49]